jgi:hypothetical protein
MNQLTEEQIAALSPDGASLSAGKGLAAEKNWVSFGYNEKVLWGEIKGSGKDPYRTQIDLNNTGFKCSCPSRKFPCKHGLGLYLLFARKPDAIPQTETEPDWVKEWIDKRTEKAEKKQEEASKPVTAEETEKKAKQKAKSQNKRLEEVAGGVTELERWLKDLLRAGLLTTAEKEYNFWEKTAARMVDAKAPGLGNMVREFQEINFVSGNTWQTEVLEQTAKMYLLVTAFKNYESLPKSLQEDVKSLVGIPKQQKELLETPDAETIKDIWMVLSRQRESTKDDLIIQRDWLLGLNSKRYALILNFAYKNQPIQSMLVPGTATQAELVFYPSSFPMRAVLKRQGNNSTEFAPPEMLANFEVLHTLYTQTLSKFPWLDVLPVVIQKLLLVPYQSGWWLQDTAGYLMKIPETFNENRLYKLLALSGGSTLDMTLLHSQNQVLPIGIWWEGKYKQI